LAGEREGAAEHAPAPLPARRESHDQRRAHRIRSGPAPHARSVERSRNPRLLTQVGRAGAAPPGARGGTGQPPPGRGPPGDLTSHPLPEAPPARPLTSTTPSNLASYKTARLGVQRRPSIHCKIVLDKYI